MLNSLPFNFFRELNKQLMDASLSLVAFTVTDLIRETESDVFDRFLVCHVGYFYGHCFTLLSAAVVR